MKSKKELLEKKELLSAELQGYLDLATQETRSLTSEEDKTYQAKEAELKSVVEELRTLEEDEKNNNFTIKGEKNMENKDLEIRQAFMKGVKTGNFAELRALDTTTQGNTVPVQIMDEIIKAIYEQSNVVADCKKINGAGELKYLVEQDDVYAKCLAEGEEVTEDDTKAFKTISLKDRRVATLVKVTQSLLNNSTAISEQYLIEKLSGRIARTLEQQVFKANGEDNQLSGGLLHNPSAKNVITTKAVGVVSLDDLLKLVTNMKSSYLKGCKFYMARSTFEAIAELKYADGRYAAVLDTSKDEPKYRLFGYEIEITEELEEIATGKTPVVFANLGRCVAMKIGQGIQIETLREKYITAGMIGVMGSFYGDVNVVDVEGYRLLQVK